MELRDMSLRLEKIETKLVYLEDFLNRLQEEMVERGRLLEKLKGEHGAMRERLRLLSRDREEIPRQKPPHY
ncbi:MAG: SlyX family protein [Spirochaetaceae bacterium]|jgi:SlyX protein|nr:SlyX family protein [Spirochaetaceae bacterium]